MEDNPASGGGTSSCRTSGSGKASSTAARSTSGASGTIASTRSTGAPSSSCSGCCNFALPMRKMKSSSSCCALGASRVTTWELRSKSKRRARCLGRADGGRGSIVTSRPCRWSAPTTSCSSGRGERSFTRANGLSLRYAKP